MIVAMAGLPGTGKSTLARALANRLGGAVIDKDLVRAALFPAPWTAYTAEQDDFVTERMLEAAAWLVREQQCPAVFLDGRTFSRVHQRTRVREAAASLGRTFHIIECTCPDVVALARIHEGHGAHPAANRNEDLYWAVKSAFETVDEPKIAAATGGDFDAAVEHCLARLAEASRPAGAMTE